MKRYTALLLCVLLLLSVCVSCMGEGGETTAPDDTTAAPETTGADTTGAETTAETTGSEGASGEPAGRMDFLSMDLTPYVEIATYKGLPYTVRELEYEISLHVLFYNSGKYYTAVKEGERTVREGDLVNVNYKGMLDGVAFEGGTAEDQIITVYEGTGYIEGFASGFIGARAGETSSFEVTFPENYGEESLAGKKVTFEFTVNEIYEFEELTDAIASELSGGAYPTAEGFEKYRRSLLYVTELWTSIVEKSTVKAYPEQQVEYYYQQHIATYRLYAEAYGMTLKDLLAYYRITEADLYASAKEYVKEDLVYYGIIQKEGITLTDEEYEEKLDAYVARYKEEFKYTDEEIEEHLGEIRENMLYDKFQTLLSEWADVTWN